MSTTKKTGTIKRAAPTPIGAAAYLQLAEEGVLWEAPSGVTIRVRDVSIIDRVLTDTLPSHLQQIVANVIDQSETLREEVGDDADDAAVAMAAFGGERPTLRSTLDNLYELGNHFAVAAWIEPQVVPTEADVTDPERQLPATRILRDDRLAFVGHVFGLNVREAQQLATFPDESA
jgi:hypothetical protein